MASEAGQGEELRDLLSSFSAGWALSDPELIREGPRARVYRCASAAPGHETVILKQITDSGACGFTDWASLSFLGEIPAAEGLVPRFLAGNGAQRAYLVEDLGGSFSLESLLQSRDTNGLVAALHRLPRAYGELHASTTAGEVRFLEIRRALPGAAGHGRQAEAERWIAALPKVERWGEALGVSPPSGWERATQAIARTYTDPGAFLAFTHGDPAPTNNHVHAGQVRLLDFEYGAYRHCLYDLTAWNVLCPLDELIVQVMRETYRDVLRPAIPDAGDEASFRHEWAMLCAFRALAMLTWISPEVLDRNHAWAGDWTAREAASTVIGRLARACDGIETLAPIQQWAENAESALLRRFPELQGALPSWPVFDF